MREYPILFSQPMVAAILAGRKTVTRRVIKEALFPGDVWAGSVLPAVESGWIAWSPGNAEGLAEFTKKGIQNGL